MVGGQGGGGGGVHAESQRRPSGPGLVSSWCFDSEFIDTCTFMCILQELTNALCDTCAYTENMYT